MQYLINPKPGFAVNTLALLAMWVLNKTRPFQLHFILFFYLLGKIFVPKQKAIDLRQEEVTTLDPELEEALSSATDTELCDLAGKSGKHTTWDLKV